MVYPCHSLSVEPSDDTNYRSDLPALDEAADHVRLVPNESFTLLVVGMVIQADAYVLGVACYVDHLLRHRV